MPVFEEVRHQPAIAGRVVEVGTAAPVPGALVGLEGGPPAFAAWLGLLARRYGSDWEGMLERADRTLSRADGYFYFLDLPDGQYTVRGALGRGSRYGTAEASARVSRDANGRIAVAQVELTLPRTTVAGRISAAGGGPIMMAAVRMEGSGERVFSDTHGQYALNGVEAGTRTLTASAQGFVTAHQAVAVSAAGVAVNVDFSLVRQA
jgi:carboxypeptidase family protein